MRWTSMVAAALSIVGSNVAIANCEAVYQSATRDLVIDKDDRSSLHTIFDQYCDTRGNTRSRSAGVGIEAVIKSIPVSFTGNYSDAETGMSNFCRNYQEVRFSTESRHITRNTVVTDALRYYNECQIITSRGVTITHIEAGEGDIIFNFNFRDRETRFQIQGVSAGPNVSCGSTSIFRDGNWRTVNRQTRSDIVNNSSLSCTRTPIRQAENTIYPVSWIGIATNLGSYTVKLQPNTIIGGQSAAALHDQVTALSQASDRANTAIARQQAEIGALTAALERIRSGTRFTTFKFWTGEYGGTTPEGGDRYDPRNFPDPEAIGRRYCPAPGIMTVTQVRVIGGGCCGYAWYTGTCVVYN